MKFFDKLLMSVLISGTLTALTLQIISFPDLNIAIGVLIVYFFGGFIFQPQFIKFLRFDKKR